jgi:O-antigen/teichoic acid export membrane protein
MFPLALILVLFAREGLTLWVGAAFAAASAPVLRWLAVGIFINSLAHAPFNVLQGIGRPDLTGKLHLVELPFYLGALYLFAHAFGIVGVAMAWVLRITADSAALLLVTTRQVPSVSEEVRRVVAWATIALGVLVAAATIEGLLTKAIFLVLVLAAYLIASWTRIVHPVERRMLLRVIGMRPGDTVPRT